MERICCRSFMTSNCQPSGEGVKDRRLLLTRVNFSLRSRSNIYTYSLAVASLVELNQQISIPYIQHKAIAICKCVKDTLLSSIGSPPRGHHFSHCPPAPNRYIHMESGGEGRIRKQVVLTKPLSLEGDGGHDNYRAPRLFQQILGLFKHVRPGSDLSLFQLPPLFNFPKSHLQCYGESVYCIGSDLLSRCSQAETSIERFLAVVSWSISTVRPLIFGVAPYNPTLGETHHVSNATLNVLLEQVSHHPPVSALHATDEKANLELFWWQKCIPKFNGTSVETEVQGKRQLKLLSRGETYEMNSPNLLIRFLPFTAVDWVGNVRIRCPENELVADLCYGSNSFLGLRRNPRLVKGKIYDASTMKTLYEINGHWDRTVTLKNTKNGEVGVLYNGEEVLSGLKTPMVKDLQEVWESETAVVWSELSKSILSRDWGRAREVKQAIEERQRKAARERGSRGETWVPRHFTVTSSAEGDWDCSPIQRVVPAAPIVVPL